MGNNSTIITVKPFVSLEMVVLTFVLLVVVLPVLPAVDLDGNEQSLRNSDTVAIGNNLGPKKQSLNNHSITSLSVGNQHSQKHKRGVSLSTGHFQQPPLPESYPNAFEMYPELSSSSSSAESWEPDQIKVHPTAQHQQRHAHQNVFPTIHYSRRIPSKLKGSSSSSGGGSSSSINQKQQQYNGEYLMDPYNMPPASLSRVSGPYFESNKTIHHKSIKAGQSIVLDCTVIMLQGRTVSWMLRQRDSLTLLTVGNITYYNDPRLQLKFRYPDNWRLAIASVKKSDEGEYSCSVSTHPVKTLVYNLKVIAPEVMIVDENGHSVSERIYKEESSLHLTCKANHVDQFADKVVWQKDNKPLSRTDNRIKIKVIKTEELGETSIYLTLLQLRKQDSGNYTCFLASEAGASAKYTVIVHVVNGELPAAVQHESGSVKGLLSPVMGYLPLLLSGYIIGCHTHILC